MSGFLINAEYLMNVEYQMNFDVQVGYSSGRGFHARWTETHKPSGLGNPTPTYSTTDFDCQSSLGVNLRRSLLLKGFQPR